jgi:1-acyl-sn-glycerol-3-phosphate acyltransferase
MKKLILLVRWGLVLSILMITGSVGLVLVIVSFGTLRNLLNRYYLNYISLFILRINGYKPELPSLKEFSDQRVLYIFNHNSYLDIFLLSGVGLSNIRYLLSEKTLIYIPLVLSAKALGTFYIPRKKHHRRRLKFLIKTTKFLKRNKQISIVGSAEGVHKFVYGIANFNRGIFHMAVEAKLNIVPLYILIPKDSCTTDYTNAKGGRLKLEVHQEIDTSSWSIDKLDEHISEVRQVYVNRFNELNPNEKMK